MSRKLGRIFSVLYALTMLALCALPAPGTFWISYVAAEPEGLDKVDAAIRDTLKDHPLDGPAFSSMTDFSAHRDALIKGDGTYK